MPRKAYKYREVLQLLREHDKRFQEWRGRGKGSHRMIFHPDINGRPASYPIPAHSDGDTIKPPYLKAVIRRFSLPDDFF